MAVPSPFLLIPLFILVVSLTSSPARVTPLTFPCGSFALRHIICLRYSPCLCHFPFHLDLLSPLYSLSLSLSPLTATSSSLSVMSLSFSVIAPLSIVSRSVSFMALYLSLSCLRVSLVGDVVYHMSWLTISVKSPPLSYVSLPVVVMCLLSFMCFFNPAKLSTVMFNFLLCLFFSLSCSPCLPSRLFPVN